MAGCKIDSDDDDDKATPVSKTVDLSTVTADTTVADGYTLTGTLSTDVKISIDDGATITLDGVTINGNSGASTNIILKGRAVAGDEEGTLWAGLTCLGDATIILKDGTTNTIKGFAAGYSGIYVPEEKTLIIKGGTAGTGALTASGSADGYGAGIGGGTNGYMGVNCGNIEIQGGVITAAGSAGAAGIGTGRNGKCGTITITGGTVTATGGAQSAGIGTGNGGTSGNIEISGGTVIASSYSYGAGIGCGYDGTCGTITITSSVTSVTATKGPAATCSIGTGYNNTMCGTVTIGGEVITDGVTDSPYTYIPPHLVDTSSLASDYEAQSGDVLSGTMNGSYKFTIADGATVTLNGLTINGDGTCDWAGITCLGDATIIIADGSENNITSFSTEYPGIYVPAEKTLIIKGGTEGTGSLTANCKGFENNSGTAAGIGAGFIDSATGTPIPCGNIEIQGGIITANGSFRAAGIGGAFMADCGNITISGGTVTAKGGAQGVGIGGGAGAACGNITITDGVTKVTAVKDAVLGPGSADRSIGAGVSGIIHYGTQITYDASCGTVTINGTEYPNGVTDSPFEYDTSAPSLLSLTIGSATIWYVEGETWSQAITNHPTENTGWSVEDSMMGDVYICYSDKALAKGDDLVSPDSSIPSDSSGFSWW